MENGSSFSSNAITAEAPALSIIYIINIDYYFGSNHSGGILGGISSGQDFLASIALKPTSSVSISTSTINKDGENTEITTKGRHDPCVGLRAAPIAEAMVALVLMDHYLRHRAQNSDVDSQTPIIDSSV